MLMLMYMGKIYGNNGEYQEYLIDIDIDVFLDELFVELT